MEYCNLNIFFIKTKVLVPGMDSSKFGLWSKKLKYITCTSTVRYSVRYSGIYMVDGGWGCTGLHSTLVSSKICMYVCTTCVPSTNNK